MRVKKLCSMIVGIVGAFGLMGSAVARADSAPPGAPPAAPPAAAAPTETPVAAASAPMATPDTKMQLGADAAFVLPLGNFSDAAGVGLGALLRYEYNVIPQLNITGRAGFIYHLSKDLPLGSTKLWTIPILVGAKYDIAQGFYGAAELGLFYNHVSVDVPGFGSASDTTTKFGGGVAAGYRFGDLEARVGLQWWDLGHMSDTMGLVASVGYSFMRM